MLILQIVAALLIVGLAAWGANVYIPMPENVRAIVNLVVALVVVGMFLWLINVYVPMAESIKAILNIVVVVATCVFVLQATGLWGRTVVLWNKAVTSATHHDSPPPPPAENH